MNLYRNESSDAKTNAQRNLCGRTHYVDEDTLRWHKSRVLDAVLYSEAIMTTQEKFEAALFAHALDSIAQRRQERRREAIHDALLVCGIAVSSSLAVTGGIAMWLLVNGSL